MGQEGGGEVSGWDRREVAVVSLGLFLSIFLLVVANMMQRALCVLLSDFSSYVK